MISKLVRRNIAANKGRLALTLLSIVLGVAFVSGSFLMADTLRSIFGGIAEQVYAGVDAQVRAVPSELSTSEDDARFPDDNLATVSALPEVEYAEGILGAFEVVFAIDDDGEALRPITQAPVITASWAGPSVASSFNLIEGRAPVGNEIAVDVAQSEDHDLALGDTITVGFPAGQDTFEIVGFVKFGDSLGAYWNLFQLETLQTMLDADGQVDAISLNAADGVTNAQLIAAVEESLGFDPRYEVISGATLVDEQNAEFNQFIDIFGYVLLGFAVVVLFVSIFIIYNTFAILIGQRIRQFGLLRSVGATGSQLRRIVLIESLIIGILAAILGLLGGILIAELLKWVFSLAGGGFPDGPIIFRARTIIVVAIVGIGVTVASALLPAFRAARIPPLSALRDGSMPESSLARRRLVATAVLGPGLIMVAAGLFLEFDGVTPRLALLGFGAALTFIGVALMSGLFASSVSRVIGAPVEAVAGIRGRLARDNASRNPQRTAATATALMIGLALITGVAVLQQSIRSTLNTILEDAVAADLFVFEENTGIQFAATSVDQLDALPEIGEAAGVANLKAFVDGETENVTGFDVDTGTRIVDIDVVAGTQDIGPDGVLVFDEEAEKRGLTLGDTVTIEMEDGFSSTHTVKGLFSDTSLTAANWVLDRDFTQQHVSINAVNWVGATFADGVDGEVAQAAAEDAVSNFPQLSVQNNAEFKEGREAQINAILYVILALLALCIVVAFIGIVNTMALSVLERTREIGLLRAVGTTRRQLKSAVRWEAVIVGLFGALLGVILGLVFGYAAVVAIPDSFVSEVSIPWLWAVGFLFAGALLGVVAAWFPARRAARLNVLDAISHE